MSKFLEYKGYTGDVEFSAEDNCLFGEVQGIKSCITYEGQNIEEITEDFHNAIDEYLESCKRHGDEPEKPFKGQLNVRISPELHRKAAIKANEAGISLNKFIESAVSKVAMF